MGSSGEALVRGYGICSRASSVSGDPPWGTTGTERVCAEGSLGRAAGGQGGTRVYLAENADMVARGGEKMHQKKLHAQERGRVSGSAGTNTVVDFWR